MGTFVEGDGNWARRHPVHLEQVILHAWAFPANRAALTRLCTERFTAPSGGIVTVTPLLDGVLFVHADIGFVRSEDPTTAGEPQPGDATKGFFKEQDVGFFVPVTIQHGAQSWVGALVPYLWVDNVIGVLSGREVYGFPKELGKITLDAQKNCTVNAHAVPQYAVQHQIVTHDVVKLTTPLPPGTVPIQGNLTAVALAIAQAVVTALKGPPGSAGSFTNVPLLFLKQFRGATNAYDACHQCIVSAKAAINPLRRADVLVGIFSLAVPKFDSLKIADTLGLLNPPGGFVALNTVAGFRIELDFRLPLGSELWTRP